ncbi:DNA-binding protein, partial [Archaeoglobales archaeon ex4484_92]
MVILDTSVVIDRVKRREEISENLTVVTFVEYPKIVFYKKFNGNIIFPTEEDYILAHKLQLELLRVGIAKPFA